MMLIFDDTGTCIKEIGGAAVPDGAYAFPRPAGLAGVSITRIRLVLGTMTMEEIPETQEQIAARDLAFLQGAMARGAVKVLLPLIRSAFDQDARLRQLEGQPVRTLGEFLAHVGSLAVPTEEQFKTALRNILGI